MRVRVRDGRAHDAFHGFVRREARLELLVNLKRRALADETEPAVGLDDVLHAHRDPVVAVARGQTQQRGRLARAQVRRQTRRPAGIVQHALGVRARPDGRRAERAREAPEKTKTRLFSRKPVRVGRGRGRGRGSADAKLAQRVPHHRVHHVGEPQELRSVAAHASRGLDALGGCALGVALVVCPGGGALARARGDLAHVGAALGGARVQPPVHVGGARCAREGGALARPVFAQEVDEEHVQVAHATVELAEAGLALVVPVVRPVRAEHQQEAERHRHHLVAGDVEGGLALGGGHHVGAAGAHLDDLRGEPQGERHEDLRQQSRHDGVPEHEYLCDEARPVRRELLGEHPGVDHRGVVVVAVVHVRAGDVPEKTKRVPPPSLAARGVRLRRGRRARLVVVFHVGHRGVPGVRARASVSVDRAPLSRLRLRLGVGVGVDLRIFPVGPPPRGGEVVARLLPRERVLHAPPDLVDAVEGQRDHRAGEGRDPLEVGGEHERHRVHEEEEQNVEHVQVLVRDGRRDDAFHGLERVQNDAQIAKRVHRRTFTETPHASSVLDDVAYQTRA